MRVDLRDAMHKLFCCTREYFNNAKEYENYQAQEKLITKIFGEYREKGGEQFVLLKVCVLDSFYSTNLRTFGVYNVAKYIAELERKKEIHKRICQASKDNHKELEEIINTIAEQSKDNKTTKLYSFATKYCFHHNQDAFVIYDSFVSKVLRFFNQNLSANNSLVRNLKKIEEKLKAQLSNTNFFGKTLGSDTLKNYATFLDAMEKFSKYYELKATPRELDHFLWVLGKDCNEKSDTHKKQERKGGQILARLRSESKPFCD